MMIGWCENCEFVEVTEMCVFDDQRDLDTTIAHAEFHVAGRACCHYADCPLCGEDVDQWVAA